MYVASTVAQCWENSIRMHKLHKWKGRLVLFGHFFLSVPTYRNMKYAISVRSLLGVICLIIFGAHEYLIHHESKIFVLIKWSYKLNPMYVDDY